MRQRISHIFTIGLAAMLLFPLGLHAQLNSNTTMYGIFQRSSSTFLGKGKLAGNPMQLTSILSSLLDPSIANVNCAAYIDGVIYTLYANPIAYDYTHTYELHRFNAMTGEIIGTTEQVSPIYVSEAQATDPLTGLSWGRFAGNLAGDRWEIACVDYRTMERRAVGQARRTYLCMGMTTSQELYGVGKDGWLYRISTVDGTDTPVGELGISNYIDDAGLSYHITGAVNPDDNHFYMTFADLDLNCSVLDVDLSTGRATTVTTFNEPTLALVTFFPEHNAEDGTPAGVSDATADFDTATLTGHVTFKLPTLTYDGEVLLGGLDYEVKADGRVMASGSGSPGQLITTTDFTFQTEGLHGIEIVASNYNGPGVHTFLTVYVGVDCPSAPAGVSAKLSEATGTVNVSWQVPQGINGGKVGQMTYTVTRYPDNEVIATGLNTTAFTDQLDIRRDVQGFTYGVKAVNSLYTGDEGLSNKVVYGAPLDVPYKADFNEAALFTTIDVKGDGKSFSTSKSSSAVLMGQYHGSGIVNAGEMDDWLLTPTINLTAGKTYRFSIPQYLHPAMKLNIAYGSEATAAAMTGPIVTDMTLKNVTDWDQLTVDFQVEATGAYHIGLHAVNSERTSRGLYIRNTFTLEEVTGDNVPNAPTQLTATGGSQGAKTVHITCVAPTKTVKGDDITAPLTIRVFYRNRIVATEENVAPGQTAAIDYANEYMADGFNDFSVTATNAEGNSAAATTRTYVGVDVPVMSGAVTVTDDIEAQIISWQPVASLGANGFYVNPDDVEYIIYDVVSRGAGDDDAVSYDEIARVKGVTTFRYDDITNQGTQYATYKGVRAVNRCGQSSVVRSSALIKGAPYNLPFNETLEGGQTNGKLWWTEDQGTTTSPAIGDDSYDSNSGCFTWTAGANDERVSLVTGKISLRGATNRPVVSYAYFGEVGDRTTIAVYAVTPDGASHLVGERIQMERLKGDDQWRTAMADLSEFKAEEYVMIKFVLTAGRRNETVKLDAISIYNILQYNLSLALTAPAKLKAGTEGQVSIAVRNTGDNPVNSFTVRLAVDDEEVFAETVSETLESQELHVVTTTYHPSSDSEAATVYLLAEVTTDIDLDEDDDWMETEVDILEATAAQPLNVQLTGQTLTWQSPGETAESITETFDDFTTYDNAGISETQRMGYLNDWLVIDGDREESQNFTVSYPGRKLFAPQSWMVWNATTRSSETPSSTYTQQYLVSLNPGLETADDWLISPLLSGNAQTVTFRLNSLGDPDLEPMPGIIEILYSTAPVLSGSAAAIIATFQSLKIVNATFSWQTVSVDLPAGARHFAIRNVSTDGMGVAVALVSYEQGRPAPVSFNVYGDAALLANVPATGELTYATSGTASVYAVSAVYANGEESKTVAANDTQGITDTQCTMNDLPGTMSYDLQGRPATKPTAKGVLITKGKKIIIR